MQHSADWFKKFTIHAKKNEIDLNIPCNLDKDTLLETGNWLQQNNSSWIIFEFAMVDHDNASTSLQKR